MGQRPGDADHFTEVLPGRPSTLEPLRGADYVSLAT